MKCLWCGENMLESISCTVAALRIGHDVIEMVRAGDEPWWPSSPGMSSGRLRCPDCGVAIGGLHHLECDVQACPLCLNPVSECCCRFDEFDPDLEWRVQSSPVPTTSIEVVIGRNASEPIPDLEPLGVDSNGCPTARLVLDNGQEVIVHFDDIPESDKTEIDGIPCTTALRAVIDVAADIRGGELQRMLNECFERDLFTLEEAWQRLNEPDMQRRPGARRLREVLPPVEGWSEEAA